MTYRDLYLENKALYMRLKTGGAGDADDMKRAIEMSLQEVEKKQKEDESLDGVIALSLYEAEVRKKEDTEGLDQVIAQSLYEAEVRKKEDTEGLDQVIAQSLYEAEEMKKEDDDLNEVLTMSLLEYEQKKKEIKKLKTDSEYDTFMSLVGEYINEKSTLELFEREKISDENLKKSIMRFEKNYSKFLNAEKEMEEIKFNCHGKQKRFVFSRIIYDPPGDGDCFFSCIAYGLGIRDPSQIRNEARRLRLDAVRKIQNDRGILQEYVRIIVEDETIRYRNVSDYFKKMQGYNYADSPMIQAVAEAYPDLHIRITYVNTETGKNYQIEFNGDGSRRHSVHLYNENNNHFVVFIV
jgi:hypothetical protein